jgi:hypothetical protein
MAVRISLLIALFACTLATPVLGQYSPQVSATISALPAGSIPIDFRGSRYFFADGAWYQQVVAGFVAVSPPPGIVVPNLPSNSTTVWVAGMPYYSVNDIFYAAAPDGFMVVPAPVQKAAPPPADLPAAQPAASQDAARAGFAFYYCASASAYYPYVSDCPEGWRSVPGNPPGLR